MKTRSWALSLIVAANLLAIGSSRAAVDIQFSAGLEIQSTSDFYQPLQDFGRWVDVPRYGRCWHPAQVASDWRPYTEGHWEWTDCGWYWASDEPWSWATYHYGSWVDDQSYGWVWIPATEWAPAWVTWRESPDYIGWAPCGPGLSVAAPSLFVFVDAHHFSEPIRSRSLIVNNTTIINRTRVINNFQREDRSFGGRRERVMVNRGPAIDTIQKSTGRTFKAQPITQIVQKEPAPQTIRRRSDAGFTRPALSEQPRNNQRGNQNDRSTRPSTENDRALSPNQTPDNARRSLPPTGRDQRDLQNRTPERSATQTGPLPDARRDATGREQPLSNERPSPPTASPEKPGRTLAPTGRDQSGQRKQPVERPSASFGERPTAPPREAIPGATPRPAAPPTAAPSENRSTPGPTGRDQSRIYQQPTHESAPQAPSAARREETAPQREQATSPKEAAHPSLPASVREKPLEPTGRDATSPKFEAPPQRVEPSPRAAEQPKREEPRQEERKDREKDKP
jgi:uncharacterized protein DUF6600